MEQVTLRQATRAWLYVAIHSFGGPAGQIAVMHRVVVEERKWISEKRFLHALNYCMLLPGPEAMQLATYVGWLMHGVRGGLIAGCLFVLPGFLAILALSIAYALWQSTGFVGALFFGIKAAVLAIVVDALWKIGKRALKTASMAAIAAGAFVAIFFFDVPFPAIILFAALLGLVIGRRMDDVRQALAAAGDALLPDGPTERERVRPAQTALTIWVWLLIWWAPVILLAAAVGVGHIFVQEAWFFSKTAVVTFGGAYAVLAYIAQRAVEDFGWLQPGEMLDGLGLAETTPGPLIQVVQFVGFMGAYRADLGIDPLLAGILASIIVTWVTFTPCFLWIFAGAPYVERLRTNAPLRHALTGITAAVVGVILNLAIWFAMHVLWPGIQESTAGPVSWLDPRGTSLDVAALVIAVASGVALWRLGWSMLTVIATAAALGTLWRVATA